MKLRTGIVGGLILVLTASAVEGQVRRPQWQQVTRQSDLALFIGMTRLDLDELNTRLTQAGYPTFSNDFPQFGLVYARTRQNVRLGFEIAGAGRPAEVRADGRYRTAVGAAYAMFNVGMEAFREGGFALHPKVGIGAGGINLTISDRQPASFDEILLQPGRTTTLTNGSLLLDASLGATYRLRPDTGIGRSLMLGVRAGYTASVLHGGWREMVGDAPGGPDSGWGGPHVEFLIGRSTRR